MTTTHLFVELLVIGCGALFAVLLLTAAVLGMPLTDGEKLLGIQALLPLLAIVCVAALFGYFGQLNATREAQYAAFVTDSTEQVLASSRIDRILVSTHSRIHQVLLWHSMKVKDIDLDAVSVQVPVVRVDRSKILGSRPIRHRADNGLPAIDKPLELRADHPPAGTGRDGGEITSAYPPRSAPPLREDRSFKRPPGKPRRCAPCRISCATPTTRPSSSTTSPHS